MSIRINATLTITQWQGQRFLQRLPRILNAYGQALDTQLREEISVAQFAWPRTTRRRSGQVVSSPRDIVDTGAFLRSQTLSREGPLTARFVWNPTSPGGFQYARTIFSGYVTNNGTVVPGRDWIRPALIHQPAVPFFVQQWRNTR